MSRSKGDVRRRLQEAALALYLEHGYDRTTAAEIAARAGVTERTFFRYFPDKREVLFDEAALHAGLTAGIAEAPDGLGPMDALHWAFRALEPMFERNRPLTEPARALIASTPALRERQLSKATSTIMVAAEALQRRGAAPGLAALAAATCMVVFGHAFNAWLEDPTQALNQHLEQAFQSLQDLSNARALPLQ